MWRISLPIFQLFALCFYSTFCNAAVIKRDVEVPWNPPGNWSFAGCYTDDINTRTLTGAAFNNETGMTDEMCIAFCDKKRFKYAGTEYSYECYCGNELADEADTADMTDCNMGCAGNSTEQCGGSDRITLFYSNKTGDAGPFTNGGPGQWSSLGCYTDAGGGERTLTTGMGTSGGGDNLTVALCVSACQSSDFTYAGVEYASECYCGNVISNGGQSANISDCDMICNGNSSEYCGGPNRLDLYIFHVSSTMSSTSTSTSKMTTATTMIKLVTSSTTTSSSSLTSSTMPSSSVTSSSSTKSSSSVTSSSSTKSSSSVTSGSSTKSSSSVTSSSSTKLSSSATSASSTTSSSSVISTTSSTISEAVASSSVLACPDSNGTLYTSTAGSQFLVQCYVDHNAGDLSMQYTDGLAACIDLCSVTTSCLAYSWVVGTPSGPCYMKSSVGFPNVADNVWGGMLVAAAPSSSSSTSSTFKAPITSSTTSIKTTTSVSSTSTSAASTSKSSSLSTLSSSSSTSSTVTTTSQPTSAVATTSAPQSSSTGVVVVGWSSLGCYTDSTGGRTLRYNTPIGGTTGMSIEACQLACQNAGYVYSGTEYAAECWCDNQLNNGGGPAPDGDALCDMACSGNGQEICGGPSRLSMFYYNSGSGSGPSTGIVSSSPVGSTTSASPVATALPSGWTYAGCYKDGVDGRILSYQNPDSSSLTVESCVQVCSGMGYNVSGMEYASQCFCGQYLQNGANLSSSDTDCSMACSGNAAEKCGGPNLMSVYGNGTITSYQAPTPQTSGLPGSWVYQGCILDDVGDRRLPYQVNLPNTNSPAVCLKMCSDYGYSAGGVEYGIQCYCGDPSDVEAAGLTTQPATDCNTACPGDPTSLCGAGNRINYYTWNGPALKTWNYPQGYETGEYLFLIGGVVVPLVTTPGVNGKVTFLEKHGTGAPNTTGAYELDLSELGNFTAAWRPMHVQTDIFCSASLTLPDKVGRQINVGGWSGESTYGIRLYWPDGKPGVWGTNDWQENYEEVALQNGRWYPSAMIMANGSILVVGGEDGSNGAPVPTLEILPNPSGGTTVYCDWLDRTDPNNLYPFLAVLPSGGVFVAYYNEARILDEGTLLTSKTMPNIPGAVNNPAGGRTYPLEGTTMLFPQYAPYSDPLTVLICGGSTPYSGVALDNCVSIQPEAANPEWVIERMPSKRVISCMTALPDGTYLILNGAQEGYAGFGLADEPNLNAVLYDPTKPVNARMSVMANTTVARLYHSEGVLLLDGRVLVSGSDPQDTRFPEEYRVEVFMPPYLLSGLPKPSYSIAKTDWTYGQQVQITILSGSTADLKISLMGAESSTHGNSMGQRTLFPAFSCSGTTCTITAPPNAHVCPPGWFKLFILDGPTPSDGQFVRIGGDPAELGKWPQFPDFTVPGI